MSPSRRRATARCAAWHPAHTKSFACHGLPAGAPRPRHGARQGRAPARWSAAGPPGSRPTAITPEYGAPQLPEHITHSASPAVSHRLCASIHPAQKLFVPLCVNTSHPRITRAARWGHRALPPLPTRITHAHYPWGLPTARRGSRPRAAQSKNYAGKSHSNHATPYGAS